MAEILSNQPEFGLKKFNCENKVKFDVAYERNTSTGLEL